MTLLRSFIACVAIVACALAVERLAGNGGIGVAMALTYIATKERVLQLGSTASAAR